VATRVLDARDDRLKLFATAMLLRTRREQRDIFASGDYNPVDVQGRDVTTFSRCPHGRRPRVIVAVPRLVATMAPQVDAGPIGERVWGDTLLRLPTRCTWGRMAQTQSRIDACRCKQDRWHSCGRCLRNIFPSPCSWAASSEMQNSKFKMQTRIQADHGDFVSAFCILHFAFALP
jgi:hypothetical protein